MVGHWKISEEYDVGKREVTITDVKFISIRNTVTDYIVVEDTTLIGGVIKTRAGVLFEEERFRHTFPTTEALWLHLVDNTELGKDFIQLLFSRCGALGLPQPIEDKIPEQPKPTAGQKRKPGTGKNYDGLDYTTSREWDTPDYNIEKE